MYRCRLGVIVVLSCVVAMGNVGRVVGAGKGADQAAPLFDKLGDHHHEIATDVPMAYWGEALVLGPNINAAMPDEAVPKAWAALQKARKYSDQAKPRHRDYIQALTERYRPKPMKDRSGLDQAYADAMRQVAREYPSDYDAQVLFAESLMDTTPWDYWQQNGRPKDVTQEILDTLERVLAQKSEHPLANHLYIHTVEAVHPEWGLACAERLGKLVPDAAHLVHMPSHIYIRVGRYEDANRANERAIAEARDDLALAEYRLREAVKLEAGLNYDEPPTWFISVRQLLGAVLLKAGKPGEAEAVYRKDLEQYPDNGWSLFGLRQALDEQGDTKRARKVKQQFEDAWEEADVTLAESRF